MLEVKNLTASLLKNISVSFDKGITVIAGENGCGKTTFAKHLNGLLKPQKGDILLEGKSIYSDLKNARKNIGIVFQNSDAQIIGQTIYDDVSYGVENLNYSKEEVNKRVINALEAVGLNKYPSTFSVYNLSGGERKRLCIAGILAMDSKVIVFDEPFAGLDYKSSVSLIKEIIKLKDKGLILIVITHEFEKMLFHSDRLIYFVDGTIACDGHPKELVKRAEEFGVFCPKCSFEQMTYLS